MGLVDVGGLEPPACPVQPDRSPASSRFLICCDGFGGRGGARTPGLIVANDALSQLSYTPTGFNSSKRAKGRQTRLLTCYAVSLGKQFFRAREYSIHTRGVGNASLREILRAAALAA